MIKSIRVINVRQHKDFKVSFGKGVTTLVGESRKGKTTVLKALKHLCFNRPAASKGLIKWGKKDFKITVEIDKHTVEKSKKGSKNFYVLDDKKLTAFGTEVPRDIARLVNVGEVNFQGQTDKAFWINETAGQLSKKLNAIVNLEKIDKTLSVANTKTKKARTAVEIAKDELKQSVKINKVSKSVQSLVKEFNAILELENQSEKMLSKLRSIALNVEKCEKLRLCHSIALKANIGALRTIKTAQSLHAIASKQKRLKKAIEEVEKNRIDFDLPNFNELLWSRKKGNVIAEQYRALSGVIQDIVDAEEQINQLEQTIAVETKNLEKKGKKTKCPKCGQYLSTSATYTSRSKSRQREKSKATG